MAFTSSKRRQAVRLLLCAALCASAALVSGSARAGGDKKDGKGDLEPFQGGWSVTSINKDKQDIPEELIKELKVSFKGNKLSMAFMGKEIAGTCTVDPSKKPKEVNLRSTARMRPSASTPWTATRSSSAWPTPRRTGPRTSSRATARRSSS